MVGLKERFPAMISIRGRNGEHICGGVLVNKRFVLTAARCIDNGNAKPKIIIDPYGTADSKCQLKLGAKVSFNGRRCSLLTGNYF